jgi:hypothetical protein
VRIATPRSEISVLSRAVAKLHLEVTAVIENAFDKHGIRRGDEGNGHAPLESGHPQSGNRTVRTVSPEALKRSAREDVSGCACFYKRGPVSVRLMYRFNFTSVC